MKATFVLTPAEARRLIAKAVIQMPEFQKAWKNAYVILAGGTTNAFIAQELLGDRSIEPGRCTVGTSCEGLLCVTEPSSRKSFPNVFYKGQPVDKKIDEALQDYHADTVIIKGANAFDLDGHVGVITSGFNGGTVPNFIGYMTSKGLKWICPVPPCRRPAGPWAGPAISTSPWGPTPACTACPARTSSPRRRPSR